MDKQRNIIWIDTAKAICMVMIFFIHTMGFWGYKIECGKFIQGVYVNTFFFISGYLLFKKHLSTPILDMDLKQYQLTYKTQFKNILFKMIIPSIIFAIIEYVPSALIKGKAITPMSFFVKTFGGGTYWFVSALVIAELILCLLLLFRIKKIWFYFVASCLLTGLGLILAARNTNVIQEYSYFPWMYKQGLICTFYLALGGVYSQYESKIRKYTEKVIVIMIMSIVYIGLLAIFPDAFKVTISELYINIPGILVSAIGVVALVTICQKVPEVKVLKFVGKNTLGYYFLCGAVPIIEARVLSKLISKGTLVGWLVLLVVSFVTTGLIVYLLKKFLPFLFDLRVVKQRKKKC